MMTRVKHENLVKVSGVIQHVLTSSFCIRSCFNCCTGCNILFRSLQFIGACKDPLMVIVTELLPGMSLRKYLISIRPDPLELHVAIKFALDIAHAMECLHANGIIHRDLKPGTIWLV